MTVPIALGVLVGSVVLGLTWKVFFRDLETLNECVGYFFKPDLWSCALGNLLEDIVGTFRFQAWMFVGILSGLGTYWLLR